MSSITVLLTILASIFGTLTILALNNVLKRSGFEGGPSYPRKPNRKKPAAPVKRTQEEIAEELRELYDDLILAERVIETIEKIDVPLSEPVDGYVILRHLRAFKSPSELAQTGLLYRSDPLAEWLVFASSLPWNPFSDRGWPPISDSIAEKLVDAFRLQLEHWRIERELKRTLRDQLLPRIRADWRELSGEAPEPDAERSLTKREELQRLRVRVGELEEEVLAEQGGEGPLRRPAGIPKDN